MARLYLFTLREVSIFTSKVDMHFMCEEMELWNSFTSPRWLNTKLLSRTNYELEDLPPALTLLKTEGLDCLSPLSLRNTKDLSVLSFPILLNTEGRCYNVDGCSLSNTIGFELDVALSPTSSLALSAVTVWAIAYPYTIVESSLVGMVCSQDQSLGCGLQRPISVLFFACHWAHKALLQWHTL